MKRRTAGPGAGRVLRRWTALGLALTGLWMAGMAPQGAKSPPEEGQVPLLSRLLLGDSSLLAQWLAGEGAGDPAPERAPEEAHETPELEAVTPDRIRERTLAGGLSLFNSTGKSVDLAAVAAAGSSLSFRPAEEGPQVLIMHTHGTEAFARDGTEPYTETAAARTTDQSYNITRVGEEIARIFEEQGIRVVHCRDLYDYPAYDGAYDRSRAGIEALLAQYPTVRMVLDIHRDALVEEDGTVCKPVLRVDGVKTAQVMLLVGTDDGGAAFPDWAEHLALALEIQEKMNALWPGLARPIALRSARFNQQLTKGSLLVEVGAHGNTLEEALAGARLFARAAGQVIQSRVETP